MEWAADRVIYDNILEMFNYVKSSDIMLIMFIFMYTFSNDIMLEAV